MQGAIAMVDDGVESRVLRLILSQDTTILSMCCTLASLMMLAVIGFAIESMSRSQSSHVISSCQSMNWSLECLVVNIISRGKRARKSMTKHELQDLIY